MRSVPIYLFTYLPIIMRGTQRMISGKARNRPTVTTSARKNGMMPRNTVVSGMSGRTPFTTKQLSPIGGVIRQI